jgi:hypothetical protein
MSTSESESDNGAVSLETYVPFKPFEDSYVFEAEASPLAAFERIESAPPVTPFVSEYADVGTAVSAEAQEIHELLFELYDQELDEALGQLAQEAWSAASDRAAMFGETVGSSGTEQFLQEWISRCACRRRRWSTTWRKPSARLTPRR